jgi:hypothetical protein
VQTETVNTIYKYVCFEASGGALILPNFVTSHYSSNEVRIDAMTGRSGLTGSKIVLADPVAARSKAWV